MFTPKPGSQAQPTLGVESKIRALVQELGWTDKAIRRRAKELKVYQPGNINVPWSEAELAILKANEIYCTNVVLKRLKEAGFDRPRPSINSKRKDMNIRPVDPQVRRKWRATPELDEAIKAAFGKKYERLGAVRYAMKATGWPENVVFRRAVELGLTTPRSDVPWTDEEKQVLEEYGHQSIPSVQRHIKQQTGKHRTFSSIAMMRARLGTLKNLNGMDLKHLAEALGFAELRIRRWLEAGQIRAILRFPELQEVGRHVWFFPNEEIRRFVMGHLEVIDLSRVEKFWFVDLIANGETQKQRRAA